MMGHPDRFGRVCETVRVVNLMSWKRMGAVREKYTTTSLITVGPVFDGHKLSVIGVPEFVAQGGVDAGRT